jgi:hypothetical protein
MYIGDPITVEFDRAPLYSKRPHCPDRFIWQGQTFTVAEVLGQNTDFGRRGRMAERSQNANMQPEHARRAAQRGSWGVGRYSFRVRTSDGRVFDIYYDRAPKDIDHPEGQWFLRAEV